MDFLIASHSSDIKGPIDFFEDYILSKGHQVVKIAHPLDRYAGRYTFVTLNAKKTRSFLRHDIGILNYLYDIFLTLKEIQGRSFDIFVGANNFDALCGLIGRLIFLKKYKIILSSDYSGKRFNNPIMNFIYELIERIAILHSDFVISNTKRVSNLRIRRGLAKSKSFVVPSISPIKRVTFQPKRINPNNFIYVGNVTPEHGLLDLIAEMRPLVQELVVIGAGNQWEELKILVKNLNISSKLYYAKNHDFVINFLQRYEGIGLAPYNDTEEWTYYCSPLKVYEYIVTGIPVLTSTRTEISEEIKRDGLGIIYNSVNLKEIRAKIKKFKFDGYYRKSKNFYKKYNIRTLFQPILNSL